MAMNAEGLYDPTFEHDACGIGAVANINGNQDHDIVQRGLHILMRLQHRGAAGADGITGDGAGMLLQLPHDFLVEEAAKLDVKLPERGAYGVAMLFLPKNSPKLRKRGLDLLTEAIEAEGLKTLGMREVPVDNSCLGEIAKSAEPDVCQLLIDGCGATEIALERKLYVARKNTERQIYDEFGDDHEEFYIPTMSCRTICYKGMFLAPQLGEYYPDLSDSRFASALAIVHQRYSTNTFPSWRLAQPFRMIAHNGEINTLRGNIARIRAHEGTMKCDELTEDMNGLYPICEPGASDSATFDNVMELLVRGGRSAPHSMMMMVPEAFGEKYHTSTDKRAFYEFHSAIMEPWDGPAAMVFTDGVLLGGTLDRNGLRPSRYVVTEDGLVVVASEVGVFDFPPEQVIQKGRLQPGRMFLVDTREGRIIVNNEIKGKVARRRPYRRWLAENRIELRGLFQPTGSVKSDPETLAWRMRLHGYTREELRMVLAPMAENGQEPIGSMGNDTPLAVLSDRPRLLFDYFKQLFAQVTNPPIDPLREGLVMSLMSYTGKQQNLLDESPEHCRQLKIPHPILTTADIEQLMEVQRDDFKVARLSAVFDATSDKPGEALREALDGLLAAARKAIEEGASMLIVSDRDASETLAPIPSLLATASLHHGLLNLRLRSEAGIIVETGEARNVMHFCLLCGYGANAINPYLAFEAIEQMHHEGAINQEVELGRYADQYINAIRKGLLKTMSKMGISTLRSYHAAQQFEAIGLEHELVNRYFTHTPSRIGGSDLQVLAQETLVRHADAQKQRKMMELDLEFGGDYHFRNEGEYHSWNPETITLLQHAVIQDDQAKYDQFAKEINDQSRQMCTLRGLFDFVPGTPVPIEEVESVDEIVKRFYTGAMSHGSISKEAHESMAIAMNRIGGMANTGEGGEARDRYTPDPNGDWRNCGVKQVASGRFGVTIDYLSHATMLQIKMAQGAKPGEGGQLPGHKVTDEIADMRHSTIGVSLISPPHHDIYSIEDLAQLIFDLKCSQPGDRHRDKIEKGEDAMPGALVSVKLVSEVGVGTVAAGVAKGMADEVLISSHDGGTGASPLSSIKSAGAPWEIGLAETQQTLVKNNLRTRIIVQVDGKLKTGRDVVVGAMLGADRFGFGTAALVSLGCLLMRRCHNGTCPVGIATQIPELRERFRGDPEYLVRYMKFMAGEVREIMAELGFRTMDEMIGRMDRLQARGAVDHWKAKGLDFSKVFTMPKCAKPGELCRTTTQDDVLADQLDWEILEQAADAIESKTPTKVELPIENLDRTCGTILSNRIVRKYGPEGLPEDTLEVTFNGSAGQSFGAFLCPGVTFRLVGDCNDYLGKGMSGGRVIVKTPLEAKYVAEENIIVGNTLLYGATSGEVFINGLAGERFAVRNSGVTAVVEGVGDHGCEYMTGGTVVCIGQTGRNFAAGMSGGIAYVLDEHQLFDTLCNLDMVELEALHAEEDIELLHNLIRRHHEYTDSRKAKWILDNWSQMVGKFVKVFPIDYRRALEQLREQEGASDDQSPATEEVFNG